MTIQVNKFLTINIEKKKTEQDIHYLIINIQIYIMLLMNINYLSLTINRYISFYYFINSRKSRKQADTLFVILISKCHVNIKNH